MIYLSIFHTKTCDHASTNLSTQHSENGCTINMQFHSYTRLMQNLVKNTQKINVKQRTASPALVQTSSLIPALQHTAPCGRHHVAPTQ